MHIWLRGTMDCKQRKMKLFHWRTSSHFDVLVQCCSNEIDSIISIKMWRTVNIQNYALHCTWNCVIPSKKKEENSFKYGNEIDFYFRDKFRPIARFYMNKMQLRLLHVWNLVFTRKHELYIDFSLTGCYNSSAMYRNALQLYNNSV